MMNLFDAKECADEFMRLFGEKKEAIDHSLMVSWFANTIMAGWDEGRRRLEADHQAERDRVMGDEVDATIKQVATFARNTAPYHAALDRLRVYVAEQRQVIEQQAQEIERAKRALESTGYTYVDGCEEWKPPVGRSVSQLLDKLDAQRNTIRTLREALMSLTNTVTGLLGLAEEALRHEIGNANVACLEGHVTGARRVLEETKP